MDDSENRSTAAAAGASPEASHSSASGASPEADWGQELGYPEWIKPFIPGVHGAFNKANKYVSVPALKMGLGRYVSNPFTGYLMILRTRGRKSGEMRSAPLGYVVLGEHVYCVAGFGRQTHWVQNLLADPKVEVILPSRAFSGLAEQVINEAERRRVLPPLLRSMGLVAGTMGMGNPWRDTPEAIAAKCEGMPLIRVRATGIAAGPEDPGGRYWLIPAVGGTLLTLWWLKNRGRRRTRS
jgi:deazaflavin-dependent oxidoreductase (nitroreductase family)